MLHFIDSAVDIPYSPLLRQIMDNHSMVVRQYQKTEQIIDRLKYLCGDTRDVIPYQAVETTQHTITIPYNTKETTNEPLLNMEGYHIDIEDHVSEPTTVKQMIEDLYCELGSYRTDIIQKVEHLYLAYERECIHVDAIKGYSEYLESLGNNFVKNIGYKHSYIDTKSELFAIGQNDDGQLGMDTMKYPCISTFRKVDIHDSLQVRKIACGSMFVAVLTQEQEVYTWGLGDYTGHENAIEHEPTKLELPLIQDVACTESAICCVDVQGRLWMWGTFRVFSINKTQSGSCIVANGTTCYTIPTLINDSNQFVAIQGGESHFVALTETGDVYTWGIGAQGQLGRPFYESKVYNDLQPTRVFFSQQIEKIYACGFHSFFITKNQVFGCGKNGFGELGLGHVNTIYHPQKLPLENISQIAGGLHHCLFLSNGSIWATGKNSDGQLGLDQSIEFTSSPIKLSISDIEFISCGVSSHHSCILD